MTWHHAARGFLLSSLPCLLAAYGVVTGLDLALDADPRFAARGPHIIATAGLDLILLLVLVPAVGALGDLLSHTLARRSERAIRRQANPQTADSVDQAASPKDAGPLRQSSHRLRLAAEDIALTILSAALALLVLMRWPAASAPIPWLATMYAVFLGVRSTLDVVWDRSRRHRMQIEHLLHRPGSVWNWRKTYLMAEVGILIIAFLASIEIGNRAARGRLDDGFMSPETLSTVPAIGPTLAAIGPLPILILIAIAVMLPFSAGFAALGLLADGLCYGVRRVARTRWPMVLSLTELGIAIAVINGAYVIYGVHETNGGYSILDALIVITGSIAGAVLIGAMLQCFGGALHCLGAKARRSAS